MSDDQLQEPVADLLRQVYPKRIEFRPDVELERAKIAFLAARTPFARRKALRKLEELRARSTTGLSRA